MPSCDAGGWRKLKDPCAKGCFQGFGRKLVHRKHLSEEPFGALLLWYRMVQDAEQLSIEAGTWSF